ncbi:MAG: hypothetical protein H0T89_25730 [Deltaproteobacteria bacterium]|nr:hypothetical protein [Deltaproteobacteria bacterium]MDQ3295910.1 hypothetical protein [Myxococcota bacterium]
MVARPAIATMFATMTTVLAGCGDNLPPDIAPKSGTRIKLGWYVFDDGARQLERPVLHDTFLDFTCRPTQFSDGASYCMPIDPAPIGYHDENCTMPVGYQPRGNPPPAFLVQTFAIGGQGRPSRLYRKGLAHGPLATFYAKAGSECAAVDGAAFDFYNVGTELPRADLARIKRSEGVGTGRVRVALDTSDDGLRVPAVLVDAVLGDECHPEDRADEPTARCIPARRASNGFYSDARCVDPVALTLAGEPVPTAVELVTGDGCTNYAALGPELFPFELYRQAGASCVFTTPPFGMRTFALGLALGLPTVSRVRLPVDGRRMWNVVIAPEDAAAAQTTPAMHLPVMFDALRDIECRLARVGDVMRCLPIPRDAYQGFYFSDAACTSRIDIALVASGTCDPHADYVLLGDPGGERIVRPLGDRYDGTLYEISTADSCLAYVPPARYVPHVLEAPQPLDGFAAATLVIDR